MIVTHTNVYDAPAVADRIMIFHNPTLPPVVIVEHFDGTEINSSAIKFQESNDGSSWSDIAGTNATINPGLSNTQTISSGQARLALHAGGNVKLRVTLIRQVDGAPLDLGVA